jgi:hypothetical protein
MMMDIERNGDGRQTKQNRTNGTKQNKTKQTERNGTEENEQNEQNRL